MAASAYNACARFEHAGKTFDFRRKAEEHVVQAVILPPGSPPAFFDPRMLWSAAEDAERRADAQTARQVMIAIPRECPPELRLPLVEAICRPWVADGMAAQIDIHNVIAVDSQEQPHAHVLLSLRRVTDAGFAPTKERAWNANFRADKGRAMRSAVEQRGNAFLVSHGLPALLDYGRRADDIPPEPQAPRSEWQQWKRSGGDPDQAPPSVDQVIRHRAQRSAWTRAEAAAITAGGDLAALEQEIRVRAGNRRPQEARTDPLAGRVALGHLPESSASAAFLSSALNPLPTSAPLKPQEKQMATKPKSRPTSARQSSRPQAGWTLKQGGMDALYDRDRAAADAAFVRWSSSNPKQAARFGVADYVDYVQKRRAKANDAAFEDADRSDAAQAAVAPQDHRMTEASRVQQRERILADRYATPDALAPHVARIVLDRETQVGRLTLHGGGELHDHGDRIEHHGAVSDGAAQAVAAAAAGHGWTKIAITGSEDFREAVAVASALREPPVETDHPLSASAARRVSEERIRRAVAGICPLGRPNSEADPRTAAAAFIAHIEARSAAARAGRPTGSTDPVGLAAARLTDLRQQTSDLRDTADEARQAADAHRSAYPLSARLFDVGARRRQAALEREAGRLEGAAARAERSEPREARRIEKAARGEALAHARAAEDWCWSPAGRAADRQQMIARDLAAAVRVGDPATVAAAARGDLQAAAAAAEAAQAHQHPAVPEHAARPDGETDEQQARRKALALLLQHEKAAHADPTRLAVLRSATAAVVAGDPDTTGMAGTGDIEASVKAAAVWKQREEQSRIERQREREQQLRRIAANENGQPGPAGP